MHRKNVMKVEARKDNITEENKPLWLSFNGDPNLSFGSTFCFSRFYNTMDTTT